MKCHIKSICSRGCLIAFMYFLPQSAQAVDIEGTFTSDSDFPVNVADPSFYTLNGEAYSGGIDSDTNLTVYGTLSSVPSDYDITLAPSVTAGDLTYNLELPANFWSKSIFTTNIDSVVSVKNFTLNLRECSTTYPNLTFYANSNSALNVRGDFLFSDTRSSSNRYETVLSFSGNGSFAIGGNFTVDSRAVNAAEGPYNCVIFSVDSANFTVGKILTLKNSNGDENIFRTSPSSAGTFTRTLGGLQIGQNGMIQLGGNAATANTTEFIFTNSEMGEYVGGLLTESADGEAADNKLNIKMVASDAANGRQIMRFMTTGGWTSYDGNARYSDSANALNEVEVSGGRLDLGMYGGMKGGSLMIMGYNRPSEAVFSATGTAADTEIGRVVFDTMSFYRGTVVFDLAETDGDFIQVDGAMTKVSGASPLVLEMNVSAYDLQAWLEASERDEWNADLMSFATEGSNVSADDFTLKLQDGITGKISISELDGISTITANLSIVPEPAEIAAAIGLAALAFAARRRRG